jgi:hypothetical protein
MRIFCVLLLSNKVLKADIAVLYCRGQEMQHRNKDSRAIGFYRSKFVFIESHKHFMEILEQRLSQSTLFIDQDLQYMILYIDISEFQAIID